MVGHQRISARLVVPAIVIIGVLAFAAVDVEANVRGANASNPGTPSANVTSSARVSTIAPIVVAPRDPTVLAADVEQAMRQAERRLACR